MRFARCTSLRGVALLLAMLVPAFAHAQVTLCIESTAALVQAFDSIDGARTEDTTLKLRAGTYALGSDVHLDYRGNGGDPQGNYGRLVISGGYDAGCNNQSGTLGATTINGSGGQRTIDIEAINNPISIDHISSNDIDWAFSNWICYQAQERPFNVSSVRFLDTRVRFDFMGCYDILIQNSLVTARADAPNDVAIGYAHYFSTNSYAPWFTMSTTTVRGGSLSLQFLPFDGDQHPEPATVRLTTNVFENDGTEVVIDGGNLYSSHNRYDSLSLLRGTLATNLDNISAPPLLQSNGVPQDNSPVVNAGTRFVPGGLTLKDLANHPRQVGDDPDMGAFETSVDNSYYLDVINTNASGSGSLAQAVVSANGTQGRQVIRFAIPGNCPRTITLAHTLTLTDDTDILGATQPGAEANTRPIGYDGAPCVILKAGAGVDDGLVFDSSQAADDLKLDLIAFSGFSGKALTLRSGQGHQITGNQFGGTIGSTTLLDVGTAIRVEGTAGDARIGGPDAAQSNLIGNALLGVVLEGTGGNDIFRNAIGDTLEDALPNSVGVLVHSSYNVIDDNWIAHSSTIGVLIATETAHHNTLRNNLISQSGSSGVIITGSAHHTRVGPDNYFGSNGQDGISLISGSFSDLSGNRYSNNDGLAIDLGDSGVNPNDPDSLIDGNATANRNQNYPVLTHAAPVPGLVFLNVEGSLTSTLGTYRMDVYRNTTCDASGNGEGASLLGSTSIELDCSVVPPNNQCRRDFDVFVPGTVTLGQYITTVVTSPGHQTSEFSACRRVSSSDEIFADGFE